MAKKESILVKKDIDNPEPVEIIAKAIIDISDGFAKINAGKLNRRAIVLLLKDATGLPMSDISKILDAVPKLKELYLKK